MIYPENKLYQFEIYPNCDEGFAIGIKSFQEVLFANYPRISHTFLGRRYSIKSLLAEHLDNPLEKLLSTYYEDKHRGVFKDFKLSEISTKFNDRTDLTQNQRVSRSLKYWDDEIYRFSVRLDLDNEDPQEYLGSEDIGHRLLPTHDYSEIDKPTDLDVIPSLQERFYGTIDTLRPLIYELQKIKSGVSTIAESSDKSDKSTTTRRYPEDAYPTCALCWRNTERYELRDNFNSNDINKSSAKFCYKHAINGKGGNSENWANYIKGRKYMARYLKEIDNLSRYNTEKDEVRYLIKISRIKEVFEKQQGFLFNSDGKDALAYYLVRSGLDNDGYRRIYNAKYKDGLSNAQIARKFNISRQAVGQTLRKIELKLHDVHKKTNAAETSLLQRTRI